MRILGGQEWCGPCQIVSVHRISEYLDSNLAAMACQII